MPVLRTERIAKSYVRLVPQVIIPTTVLTENRLPEVCAVTGLPAPNRYQLTAGHTPPWAYGLLLPAVLPYLIAAPILRRNVTGGVTLSEGIARRQRLFGLICLAALSFTAVTLLFTLTNRSPTMAAITSVMLATGVSLVAVARLQTVGARLSRDGTEVTLVRAHRDFVRSLKANQSPCAGCPSMTPNTAVEKANCERQHAGDETLGSSQSDCPGGVT